MSLKIQYLTCAAALLAATLTAQTPAAPDPQMKAVLDQLSSMGGKPAETLTPVEARKQPTPADAVKALLQKQGKSTAPEAVEKVEDRSIPGPGGQIPIRIYMPKGTGPFPVVLYIHGGGWVFADLNTYDSSPRALANAAGAVVVSTHYRQGPENKFPAAHNDVYAAYQWVRSNATYLKGDPGRISVVGESAGGNMALGVALMARQKGGPMPVYLGLIYPVAQTGFDTPSYRENANAKPLNRAMMQWFFKNAARPGDAKNPLLALTTEANLKGLPPTTIITAQIDPLRSEGKELADKMMAAGVPVAYRNYAGVTHEFFGMGAVVDKAKEAVNVVANELKKAYAASAHQ